MNNRMRYSNNSNYKKDSMIRKELRVAPGVVEEFKKVIRDSSILKEDDNKWPEPDRVGD